MNSLINRTSKSIELYEGVTPQVIDQLKTYKSNDKLGGGDKKMKTLPELREEQLNERFLRKGQEYRLRHRVSLTEIKLETPRDRKTTSTEET